MTRCESYPPCFGTIYFPTAPVSQFSLLLEDFAGFLLCTQFIGKNLVKF